MTDVIVQVRERRDSTANWSAKNPILADGETGYDKTLRRRKTGDGVSAWNALVYDGIEGKTTFTALSRASMLGLNAYIGDRCVRVDTDDEYVLVSSPATLITNWLRVRRGNRLVDRSQDHVILVSGNPTIETPIGSSAVITADLVRFVFGTQGWKATMAGASVGQIIFENTVGTPQPRNLKSPVAALGARVWIEDATKVIGINLVVYSNASNTQQWIQSIPQAKLVTGWNTIRFAAANGVYANLKPIYQIRLQYNVNGATSITVGHIWAETPAKARMLFILDRGYKTAFNGIVPEFNKRNLPISFSLDPLLNGTGATGTPSEVMSDADFATCAAMNIEHEFTYHSYDGSVTATMTAAQLIADHEKGSRMLGELGLPGPRLWRSAFTQNSAPQWAALNPYLVGSAAALNNSGGTEHWPPTSGDFYNMSRFVLHGRNNATVDALFQSLRDTRGMVLGYTHGLADSGGNDITTAEFAYLMNWIDTGISEDWLEVTTFTREFLRTGGRVTNHFGIQKAEWVDPAGVTQSRLLM